MSKHSSTALAEETVAVEVWSTTVGIIWLKITWGSKHLLTILMSHRYVQCKMQNTKYNGNPWNEFLRIKLVITMPVSLWLNCLAINKLRIMQSRLPESLTWNKLWQRMVWLQLLYKQPVNGKTTGKCQQSTITSAVTIHTLYIHTYIHHVTTYILMFFFSFYFSLSSGIFSSTTCGKSLDHSIVCVGWGKDAASGKEFWIVRNSWGTGWGEGGYIRMLMGINQCGVEMDTSYPIVAV